jgi:hypothetical protein
MTNRMTNTTTGTKGQDAEIIARRRSFDGVDIFLHADGALSTRTHFIGRSKLPADLMWRVADDLALYTYAEVHSLIKSVRSGTWQKEQARAARVAANLAVPEGKRVYREIALSNGASSFVRIR